MKQQKVVRAYIDLNNPDRAIDQIGKAAGGGNWRVVSLSALEGLTHSMQESMGSGDFEAAGDNPVAVLAVVEEA